jgi:hypothetical protein
MKEKIYLVSPNFIEEKIKKIFDLHGDIGFIARFGLVSGKRTGDNIHQRKEICIND